jgi:hypothetical protein
MRKQGLFQPLLLAGTLATGALAVWSLAALWAVALGQHLLGMAPQNERLVFLRDGTPRILRSGAAYDERQYLDLEGNPVPPPANVTMGLLWGSYLPAAPPPRTDDDAWDQRLHAFADGGSPAVYWYFVSDGRADGTAYFVGYDSKSRTRVGFLGTDGFRPETPAAEELIPFGGAASGPGTRVFCTQPGYEPRMHPHMPPGARGPRGSVSPWDVYVLGSDGKLYHANLATRTVHVAVDEPTLRSVALEQGTPDPVQGTPSRLVARLDDHVLVLDERGQQLSRYPIPEALRGVDFSFGETTTGEAVLFWNSPFDILATEVEYRLWWVNSEGRCREATATLAYRGDMQEQQVLGGLVVPSPVVLAGLVASIRPAKLLEEGLAATYGAALGRALREFGPALVLACLVAAGFALLCYRRQVRYGTSGPERVAWPLFVLALGLPGWIAYRFGRSWPVLEACPVCDCVVPQDRSECARCAAEFATPAVTGTEVFA